MVVVLLAILAKTNKVKSITNKLFLLGQISDIFLPTLEKLDLKGIVGLSKKETSLV